MIAIVAQDVIDDVRRILSDASATTWTEGQIVANMKMAEKAVKRDAPAAAYSTVIAFNEGVTLDPSGTEGALASTDIIDMDVRWQDALTHYTAFLCFSQSTRDTVNKEFADRERKFYEEAL